MHVETARWTRQALAGLDLPTEATALDAGSSTLHYRTVEQPHIEELVLAPLRARGVRITHLDVKDAPGVDVICDLDQADERLVSELGEHDLVLFVGVLQCVRDPEHALDVISKLVAPGGYLVVHQAERARRTFDPADNMLRATPGELTEMLERRGFETLRADSVRVDDRRYYRGLKSRASSVPLFGRFWLPLPGFSEWLRLQVPALRWRQSCVVMRRVPAREAPATPARS